MCVLCFLREGQIIEYEEDRSIVHVRKLQKYFYRAVSGCGFISSKFHILRLASDSKI